MSSFTSKISDNMKQFMFTEENLVKYFTNFSLSLGNRIDLSKKYTDKPKQEKVLVNNIFSPNETDKFFWIFYIIHYGVLQYEQIHNKFVEEKKFKFELIEEIRKHKDILKQHKWKRNQIENELANEKEISITTFMCLLTIYSYSFAIKKNFLFFEKIIHDDLNLVNLIVINKKTIGMLTSDHKETTITEWKNSLWNIENYKKPLKSISNYKIQDLKNIAKKLHLNFEKMKKKEIYSLITENLD